MTVSLYLVTGATGVIGPLLVQALLEKGHRVRVLVRRELAPGELPASVEVIKGDVTDPTVLDRSVADVDTVFHLAAKLHINNPDPALAAEYRRVNVEATERLLAAARAAEVGRVVYFGSICVYGPGAPGEILNEDSVIAPDTLYAETKAAAEKAVLEAKKDNGDPLGVVLRLAAVYGSHMKGNYPRLVRALRKGRFRHIGAGANRRTLVHETDVVAAALLAAEHPGAAGKLFNVTDGSVHTIGAIVDAICAALGIRSPRFHVPERPVRLMAGTIESLFRLAGKRAPIGRATVDKLLEDVAVSGARLQTELGFVPQIALAAGWREAVTAAASAEK
jgi:UDP-glucose 4-epimerase